MVRGIQRTVREGGHHLFQAGTGLGKTISALVGALGQTDGPIVYATRTNAQQTQVLKEARTLREAGQDPGLVVPLMGRRHYCPLLKDDVRFQGGTADELGRLCRDAKRKALQQHSTGKPVKGACSYYAKLLTDGTGPVQGLLEAGPEDAAAFGDQVARAGSCAYEALKMLLPQASLVVLPAVFLIDDGLRRAMMDWLGAAPPEVSAILDEAHHLPDAIRAHHSPRLTLGTLERAMKEAEGIQDPTLAGRILTTSLLHALQELIQELADEYAPDQDDGWVPPDQVTESILMRLQAPTPVLERAAREMQAWGESIRETRRHEGKLPRSYLGAVADFLAFWNAARDAPYVHLVTREPRPALEAYLLDPAAKAGWLQELHASVHMSGTLRPIETHHRLLGLPAHTKHTDLASPFDPERLRLYSVHGIRRPLPGPDQDAEIVHRQQEAATVLLRRWQGRIGVFFPSHAMLQEYVESGAFHGLDAATYQEEPGCSHGELEALVQRFKATQGKALLIGVLGGRLTEGLDYPGDMMEHMLIMGVPYPRPSARQTALIQHFEREDGAGWRIAVHDPTGRTLAQTVGRLIRGPEDQGTAVILDERAVRFRDHLPTLRMVAATEDAVDDPLPMETGFLPGGDARFVTKEEGDR